LSQAFSHLASALSQALSQAFSHLASALSQAFSQGFSHLVLSQGLSHGVAHESAHCFSHAFWQLSATHSVLALSQALSQVAAASFLLQLHETIVSANTVTNAKNTFFMIFFSF